MGGKAPSATTTVTKSDPWSGQQPYLTEQFDIAKQLYNKGSLAPAYYPGQTVAPQSADTIMAQGLARGRALAGSPITNAANQNLTETLQGKFLDPRTNPGYGQTMQDVRDQFQLGTAAQTDAAAARAGAFGGSAYNELTQRNNRAFADSLNKTAGDMYNNERQNQLRAGLLAPQIAASDYNDIAQLGNIGAANENYMQQLIGADMDRYNQSANRDALALQNYRALTEGQYGGSSSSTQSGGQARNSGFQNVLGGALLASSLFGNPFGAAGAAGAAGGGGLLSRLF